MSAKSAPDRRRQDRRTASERKFWRALKGDRRVSERRRDLFVHHTPAGRENDRNPASLGRPVNPASRSGSASARPPRSSAEWPPGIDATTAFETSPDVALFDDDSPPITINLDAETPRANAPGRHDNFDTLELPPSGAATPSPTAPVADDAPEKLAAPGTKTSEHTRVDTLRAMLKASEARLDRANRSRRPVLAKGARVRVVKGDFAGHAGVIQDADYIESRVLLQLDERERPCWVSFTRIGHP